MTDELKPCPFCGGEPYDERHFSPTGQIVGMDEQGYFIGCGKCGYRLSPKIGHTMAIRAWNTRTKSPEYEKLLAFVKELAKDFPDRDNFKEYLQEEAKELLKEINE